MKEKIPKQDQDTFPLLYIEGEPISTDGMFTKVYESSIDPNYVVKDYGWVNDFEAQIKIDGFKTEYRDLQNHFGRSIPQSSFFLKKEPEKSESPDLAKLKEIKIIQERVFEDTDLDEITDTQKRQELESFILQSLDIFKSSYEPDKDRGILVDATKNNLMFGHTFSDPKPRLYFVDSVHAIRPTSRQKAKETFSEAIRDMHINSGVISEKMVRLFGDLL